MFKAAKQTLLQAYPKAPWRTQAQVIGTIAFAVVFAALLASVYLAVSVKAANLGRETQEIQLEILELQRENANLQTRLAELSSADRMRVRAEKMGFRELTSYDLEYLSVAGYIDEREAVFAPPPGAAITVSERYPAELNQTLFDWLQEQIRNPEPLTGVPNLFGQARPAAPSEP